jgi:hypothetical protein
MSGMVEQFEGAASAVRSDLLGPLNRRGYIGVIAKVVESIRARPFPSSWHSNARQVPASRPNHAD